MQGGHMDVHEPAAGQTLQRGGHGDQKQNNGEA